MSKKTLFKKLFLLMVVTYIVLGIALLTGAKKYIQSANIEFFEHELTSNAQTVMPLIEQSLSAGYKNALNNTVNDISRHSNRRLTVTDLNGVVLADSENEPSSFGDHSNREEIKAVLSGQPYGESLRYSTTLQENLLYVAVPVILEGKPAAVLRLSVPVKNISLFTHKIFKSMTAIIVLIVVLALLAAYFISRQVSKRISNLSAAALKIAAGDFNAKVVIRKDDEIGELGKSFNKMSEEINRLFSEVSEGKDTLDKILSSVSEEILLSDKDGKILLFNDAFKTQYANVKEGRYYWEFVRNKEIESAIGKIKTGGESTMSGEIEADGKYFYYYVSKIKSEDSFVITLRDITSFRRLDEFKKDFIANASHELKTPVTAIAGFAETLDAENLPQESRHYAEIIKKHAQRLSNIINDLLSLSSLENAYGDEKIEVDIVKTANDIVNMYKKKAEEKKIRLVLSALPDVKNVYANEFNMEQMFVNLIDNAVKYTDKGGITVEIKNDGGFVEVKITDTGIGIAKEHLLRLFERFYVVNKSRSRKTGGTGLGLSIVKHIVNSNNGAVTVESTEGKGTAVIVKIPQFSKSM